MLADVCSGSFCIAAGFRPSTESTERENVTEPIEGEFCSFVRMRRSLAGSSLILE